MSDEIRSRGVFVLVGCGAAKQDTDEPVPAHDLYTSSYFSLKHRFAEAATQWAGTNQSSAWTILSAEHGILPHRLEIEPYDTTIEDLDERAPKTVQERELPNDKEIATKLDLWARRCAASLESWLHHPFRADTPLNESPCGQLLVLAGRRYIDPLRERGAFEGINNGLPVKPRFPFEEQELGGIGEQMAWLKAEAKRLEADHSPAKRSELSSFDAGYEREKALWQLDRPAINAEATEQSGLGSFEEVPANYRPTEQHELVTDGDDQ